MSRSFRGPCCATACLVWLALGALTSTARGERLAFRNSRPSVSRAAYAYVPPEHGLPAEMGYGPPTDMGYVPPMDGGSNGGPAGGSFDGGWSPDGCGCAPCDGGCGCCETCDPADCGGDYDCCDSVDGRPLRCCEPRYVFFGDFIYLQATDVDVTHAQQQNGIGGAGTVPFGDVGTVEMEFNPGFRVGGAVACGPCSGVTFSFTHYESDAFNSVEAPGIQGGGGAVGSLVHHPGAALTASAGPVDATYEIDFQLADVMCRSLWKCGPCYAINYMLGAQFGHLDQDFAQTGNFGGGLSGTVDTTTTINFDGGGLKAGLDAERQFGHGLAAYGRLTTAAMSGRFSSRYTMFNSTTEQLLAQANWQDDRVVGQVEYEVGLSRVSMNNRWRATVGYMFSYWVNAVTTSEFIDAVQLDNYVRVGDTIGFDGLVSRVEFRW